MKVGAAIRETHQHESAAADVAGERMRDRQRESDRDRRIHRIAAGLEHRDADVGGQRLLRDHHGVVRMDGLAGREAHSQQQSAKDDLKSHKYFDFTVAGPSVPIMFVSPRGCLE